MRLTMMLMALLAAAAAWAADAPEPRTRPAEALRVFPVRPGGGQLRPMGRADEGPLEQATGIDALALRADRPSWAPIPVLGTEARFISALEGLLRSGNDRQRQGAALLLGQIASQDARPALAAALSDGSRPVRLQAGIALTCLADRRGMHATIAALDGEPDWVKVYAVLGLWRLDAPAARAALEIAGGNQSEFIGGMIQEALQTPVTPSQAQAPEPADGAVDASAAFEAALDAYLVEVDWWWHNGSYDHCIRAMETMLLLDPAILSLYEDIAYLQWSLGYNAEAILTLERGTRVEPSNPEAWYYLGRHYLVRREFAKAVPPLRRAVELGGDTTAQEACGLALFRAGLLEESLALWEKIFEADPTDAHAAYEIERIRRALGEDSDAG